MFEVTVEDSFAAGHYLRNYRDVREPARAQLEGAGHPGRPGTGQSRAVLDLGIEGSGETGHRSTDHQMINDLEPFKVLNPSAENLAKYFYNETNANLDRVTRGRVRVKMSPYLRLT